MGNLTRRDLMMALGAPPLGALASEFGDLRRKARKNLKLAVMSIVYAGFPLEEAARRIRADGFAGVHLDFAFADVRFDPLAPDWEAADRIRTCFERHGVRIIALSGYHNLVDPDAQRRRRGDERMRVVIANWKRLGSPIVCTETGTLNRQSEWLEAPENASEEAFAQCRASLAGMAALARQSGAIVAIEAYWRNVIDGAERAERLFREIGSPALKLVMDPCNYYRRGDLARVQPVLEDIFRRVGRYTVVAHAKDVIASNTGTDLPAAGKGVLDYPLFLRLLAGLDSELYLTIEHLTLDDVPRARQYVLDQFDRI
jgi:sugar phosphate isomerase/epimerase